MSTFHQVLGLWLAPDFSGVQRGTMTAPHVDFDAVDTRGIAETLAALNQCGENVIVRVPNDAIDQVTVQSRMTGRMTGSPECEDFAIELLALADGPGELNVRASWADLHALPNRRQAPPPVLVMFVVSGEFDAVMLWSQQFMMRLGIRAADILKRIAGEVEDTDHEGHLPDDLAQYLGRTFAIPYRQQCMVTGLANSPRPF